MDTYFLLSAVFFVLLILFQALQSVGKKMNKIANTYGVRKEKPQPYVKSEPKVEIAKEEMKNHNKSFYIDSIKLCYTKAIKKSTKTITVDV